MCVEVGVTCQKGDDVYVVTAPGHMQVVRGPKTISNQCSVLKKYFFLKAKFPLSFLNVKQLGCVCVGAITAQVDGGS